MQANIMQYSAHECVIIDVSRRYFALLAVMLSCFGALRAQYDPHFSHYWAMEPAYNVAAVGKQQKINIAAAYNMALTGFENNPKTMYAAADMPVRFLNMFHGVGAHFINDQIGLFAHKQMAFQYAAKFKLFGGQMSVGIEPGFISESFDGSKVDTETPNDPAFPTSEATGSTFDLGAGIYYIHPLFYAGLSAKHLMSPTINLGETQELNISPTYFFTAGCNIKLRNPFFSIHPSAFASYDGATYRADITARVQYSYEKKKFHLGLGYSTTNSATIYLGGTINNISLGYSYEIYTSALSFGNGGHELRLGYQMDLDFQKKGRNRHKSVRLL